MNMDITRFAIEKNRIFLALLVVVLVSGIAAYRDMPRDEEKHVLRTETLQLVEILHAVSDAGQTGIP